VELNMTVAQFWWLILGLGLAVVLVVAVLLIVIAVAAKRIERAAWDVWTAGKAIAANTVNIAHLQQTNATAGKILGVANDIAAGAGSIDARLEKIAQSVAK
jgi:hypothetical protein